MPTSEGMSPLFQAAAYGDEAALDEALAQEDVELDDLQTMPGVSPLMLAARGGHLGVMARLLAAGATLDLPNAQGLTALHVAAMSDQDAAVAALLEAGADAGQATGIGGGLVHLAAAGGAVQVLRLLEQRGFDLTAEDPSGRSPEDYARSRDQEAALTFLDHHRLRDFYQQVDALRRQVGELHRMMSGAEASWPERLRAEQAEEAAAEEVAGLPGGIQPDTEKVNNPFMRRLSEALPAVTPQDWEKICKRHGQWLAAGGASWPGVWECLVQSEVVFALYAGPEVAEGEQADLHLRRLEGVDGRDADLRNAHLVGMVAEEIDLRGADLSRTFMTDASLRGARLDGANLARADLSRSDLRGASLVGADLSFTDLERCDLRGADLRGARLRGTKLPGADLRGAIR